MLKDVLKTERQKAGLSQADVAHHLKITRQAYNNYETGARKPSLEMMDSLAKLFNVSTDYLLGREDTKKEAPSLDLSKEASARLEYLLTMVDSLTDEEWQKVKDYLDLLKAAQQGRKDD